ncbi:hypothetical protein BCV69DRAFT_294005 [Microstroma glucosiphilum]|uniref:Uncharacterized protein n=1 Tax=Pseudomicrostroma glucosiphilum TaxID=1684307 RepID=A0A316U4T9_9BASI|nr:hypothetical protein BCV69DRAFT_294005 [Pseudomicrostroma glucosiphilum]PWN20249.1 hypothetical protein BCV69DRAFT_294005 [Pseudomicrostroma glucosiphilum]
MSLDPALFTLHFLPRQDSPSITDLSSIIPDATSKTFTPTYTLSRAIRSPKYQNTLLDGLTYTELGSVSASSTSEKCKSLKLFNPDQDNEVRKAGAMLRTEWQFAWQGEKLAISKELAIGVGNGKGSYDVEIIRKPDPPIKIAIYRPESKKMSAFLQVFDYNIDRCEAITDKRGLEHTLILAIASCLDTEYDERHRTPDDNVFLSLVGAAPTSPSQGGMTGMPTSGPLEPNEVVITPLVEPAHVVEHCLNLLKSGMDGADPRGLKAATVGQNLELVVIKAVGEEMAKRAIGIAERVKVGFYRLPDSRKGKLWDGTVPAELYQYVRTSELKAQDRPEGSKPPVPERPPAPPSSGARPRIKLGGGHSPEPTSTPQPPASPLPAKTPPLLTDITIFLSKTKLEEFEAERSQQARLYEEEQSRRLAERLQKEQVRQEESPASSRTKGQASRRPMSGGQNSPDATRLKPSAHRNGRPTSAGGSSEPRNGVNAPQDDPRNPESAHSHDEALSPNGTLRHGFGSCQNLTRHATWSSRPTHPTGYTVSYPAATNHAQRDSPHTALQSSARDARPASFFLPLQDDSTLVKVKTPKVTERPVVVVEDSRIPPATTAADAQSDASASEAGATTDRDDAEDIESLCEAECGSWYGSECSFSSEATGPPLESEQDPLRARGNNSKKSPTSRVLSNLPPPILARGTQPSKERATGKEERPRAGAKAGAGRWSSTPIRDLHEQWAADFRGGGGAMSRKKRGVEKKKEKVRLSPA